MTVSAPVAGSSGAGRRGAGCVGHRTDLVVLGTVVTIDAARPAWADRLRSLLAPFVVASPAPEVPNRLALAVLDGDRVDGGDDRCVLVRGTTELARGSWAGIEARILAEVNTAAIDGYDGLAVHAGVVAVGDRAICFPGESGLGKSTMTAACVTAGFDYVSDEALCVDHRTGAVVPYPRPIALARSSLAILGLAPTPGAGPDAGGAGDGAGDGRELVLTASSFGGRSVEPDRRLHLTDVVELRRGATEVHLEPLHRTGAVTSLLAMAFNHFKEPAASFELIAALARGTRVWRLHHDDPRAAAAELARQVGGAAGPEGQPDPIVAR